MSIIFLDIAMFYLFLLKQWFNLFLLVGTALVVVLVRVQVQSITIQILLAILTNSYFKYVTKTSRRNFKMKHFNRRAISVALLITLGTAYSVNASAAELPSIEKSISEMVVAQSQQVVSDMALQLQQSITEEINSFSAGFSFDESISESIARLTEKEETLAKQSEENLSTEVKLLD